MCFTWQMSVGFAALGSIVGGMMLKKFPSRPALAGGVWYFCLMELIQAMQFLWVDQCDAWQNKALTLIGVLHISFQPYVIHLMTGAFAKTDEDRGKNIAYRRMAVWAGVFLLVSGISAYFSGGYVLSEVTKECLMNPKVNHDWVRATDATVCTRRGLYHLAWSVPMAPASYWTPNSFLHAFVLFTPYFCDTKSVFTGLLFLVSGPLLAALITPEVHEQAAIWCFFSILQIVLVSGRLLVPYSWRHGKKAGNQQKQS